MGNRWAELGHHLGDYARKARLEEETDRWAALPAIPDWQAPELRFDELVSAAEVDAALRELATFRRAGTSWSAILRSW